MIGDPNSQDFPGRCSVWENAPPHVRAWVVENFSAFRLDGFDTHGNAVELCHFDNTMQRWALYESMRRTLAVNEASHVQPVVIESDDG